MKKNKFSPANERLAREAMVAMRDGDFATAADCFQKLGKLARADDQLAKAAGFANLHLGNHRDALNYLSASLKLRASQPDVHAALGDIYVGQFNRDKALPHLRRAVLLAPQVPQLRYKLGLALIAFDQYREAAEEMQVAVSLNANYFQARLGLARALTELGEFEAADAELDQAERIDPNSYAVTFRRGKLKDKQQQLAAAIDYYKAAEAKSGHAAPVCEALALAQLVNGDPEAARATLKRGLAQHPADRTLLQHSAELRYEMGDPDAFSAYKEALQRGPSAPVHADYIGRLNLAGRSSEAELELQQYENTFGRGPGWLTLAAQLHYEQKNYSKMLELLANVPPDQSELRTWLAKALLASGDAVAAQTLVQELSRRSPQDQYVLALLSTCYRLNDSSAYDELVDYDRLLIRTELATPPAWDSLAAFNSALRDTLEEFHITRKNPLSQSVVGGTQTPGNLLLHSHPVIAALRDAIHSTLARELGENFYRRLNESHPVSTGRGKAITLPAAWSIWVTEGGYHRSHVHSKGWYSSAYYVSLPEYLKTTDAALHDGALAFGRPAVATSPDLDADRTVAPEDGILTLFPSYFWHGTLPFQGPEPRVVVAFDAVPAR